MVLNMNKSIKWGRTLLICRYHSKEVRVRFAPSPTGHLHLGGLRTALFNYLFARSNKGKLILRIEDTDRKRIVSGAIKSLEDDLNWAGLTFDEGPSIGGSYGPYVQSERTQIYHDEVKRLLANGSAYWCFCSEQRLDLLRRDARRNQKVPRYDNRCRNLSPEVIKEKIDAGLEKCVRFKLGAAEQFVDAVYGGISHDVSEIEGDPVILKKDGYPTYHLANVIDDHYMKISHVIRGVEWLQSTSKHIMLYRALGYEPPQFAHLPLILNSDGSKLSKRKDDVTISWFRTNGIQPRALVNLVCYSGGGFQPPLARSPTIKALSMDQLAKRFDLGVVNTNSCKLPMNRLTEFNQADLVRQISDPEEINNVVTQVKAIVSEKIALGNDIELLLDDNYIKEILMWSGPRISSLYDLVNENFQFLWVKPDPKQLNNDSMFTLEKVYIVLKGTEFCKKSLSEKLREFSKEEKIKFKSLMQLLRTTLSGVQEGPGVAEMMELLGKDTSLERVKTAIIQCSRKNHFDLNKNKSFQT